MTTKICKLCNKEFDITYPAQKYCVNCRDIAKRACRERDKIKRRTGVGSGNSPTNRGKTHPNYKNGIGMYKKIRDARFMEVGMKCERCDKSLVGTSCYDWCGHHKDHDRTHNDESNIEILCKRCHQLEHDCIKNLNV